MPVYDASSGDTLADIARQFRVTPERLALLNGLSAERLLVPGQALYIPSRPRGGEDGTRTYTVQPGDTLRTIADRHHLPLTWLAFSNLLDGRDLVAGEVLLLPERGATASSGANAGAGMRGGHGLHTPATTTPRLQLMAPEPLHTPEGHALPLTYTAGPDLRVDALGNIHIPPQGGSPASIPPQGSFPPYVTRAPQGTEAAAGSGGTPQLSRCVLDRTHMLRGDVGRVLLENEAAWGRMVEGLLRTDAQGVIFAWQVRSELVPRYLQRVREIAGELRGQGREVGLYLPNDSTYLRRRAGLARTAAALDHLFFDPLPHRPDTKPPAPLVGLADLQLALDRTLAHIPAAKTWLLLRPAGVALAGRTERWRMTPHQALRLAEQHRRYLQRDEASGLLTYRVTSGEEGWNVWLEDLRSLMSKLDLLHHMKLQGLALWEQGAYMPDAWSALYDLMHPDAPPHDTDPQ